MEANKKRPSGLGKIKDTSREEDVEFIAGDIYDLSDTNRYTDKFKYYSGQGNGYITDKEGHVYDVVTSSEQGDAGRIAGGSHDYYVTIKNVNGKDLHFHGYSAVFSSSSYTNIIEDIKAGMYLEDYLAKNWGALNHDAAKDEKIAALKEKGNVDAKTYKQEQEDSALDKKIKFWERYVIVKDIIVTIKNGDIEINDSTASENWNRKLNKQYPKKERNEEQDTYNQRVKEYKEAYDKYKTMVQDALKPVVADMFSKKFGCTLTDMNGLTFSIVEGKNRYLNYLGFDTKKKQFVTIEYESTLHKNTGNRLARKNDTDKMTPAFGPTMTLNKDDANEKTIAIFMNAANEYQKLNKGQQSKWVADYWYDIWHEGNGTHWLYGTRKMTKSEAKKEAADRYKKNLADHSWNNSGKTITFLTEFISQFMTAPEKIEKVTGEEVENSPVEKPRRGENTKISAKARGKQEEKMDAWHNGTRKQNVKSCSDAKLKINYDICVDKGYTHEAELLKKEAQSRGLTFESISWKITDYIEFM